MKKTLIILVPLLLLGYLIVITLIPRSKPQRFEIEDEISFKQAEENKSQNIQSDHGNQELNCKSCHACEYPTRDDPCLIECPREDMVSVYHSPKEGPEIVVIDEMSEYYEGVVFSHKMHSEMSEISTGCTNCHHYNTTGPVLNCRKCHESVRTRVDISLPDLKAAYHRQCMTCHKQWSGENGCNTQCHIRKDAGSTSRLEQSIKEITGKSHPVTPEPTKILWETNYSKGKIVTFFHDEHVRLFNLSCSDCHSKDNCMKCHGTEAQKDFTKIIKIKKSLEEHHKPCGNCHYMKSCQKCHKEGEMLPFNHGRSSGWNLKWYHSRLSCAKCHGNDVPFRKLNNDCVSCHKNFTNGKFNHRVTGLVLSEVHRELECNNCHEDGNFAKAPQCSECHDDRSYPDDLPGNKK